MPLPLTSLLAFGLLVPPVLLSLSVLRPYRVGAARDPHGAWVSTMLVGGFAGGALAITLAARLLSSDAPGVFRAVGATLVLGLLLGMLGASLSEWQNRRGVMYFLPNRRVTLAIVALASLRLLIGGWRVWSAWVSFGAQPRWMAGTGVAGTLAAAAVLTGYGIGLWGAVRWRIARRKALSLYAIDDSAIMALAVATTIASALTVL